jgi:hypothetical protein
MPTNKGILSLRGNVLIAYNYENEGYATAEAIELSIRMQPVHYRCQEDSSR